MRFDELVARWEQRRQEAERLHASAPIALVAREVLADLDALRRAEETETLSLDEAGQVANYHPDSVSRLIRRGKLRNVGTKARPRVLRGELAAVVGTAKRPAQLARGRGSAPSSAADTIARDAIAGRIGRPESA